jgi:putative ABC transport system permease protein
VALNEALAAELGAAPGDEVILSFERPAEIPRETVVGRQEAAETLASLRLSVAEVIPDAGVGGFSLAAKQGRSLNAFVDLARLQREIFGRGAEAERANLVLASFPGHRPAAPEVLMSALRDALTLDDLGLELYLDRDHPAEPLVLESRSFVLAATPAQSAVEWARQAGGTAQPVLTYLATALRHGNREVPYSTVAAFDPPASPGLGSFRQVDGSPAPALGEDEILLNAWAADDLGAEMGDDIELDYYVVRAHHELTTETARFRLAGVVAMAGEVIDEHLTPEFPGMQEAEDISAWDPPFPVDLARIRSQDEEYWDRYRAAPKAFVSEAAGRRLWRSRFGDLTSIRLAPREGGETTSEMADRLARELPRRIDPQAAGLLFRPLRADGLAASAGSTDFSSLFLGLSMFLIASAALLCALLFGLGVENRAREVGLLRAVGYSRRAVRRRLLGEGIAVAAVGGLAGLVGAIGYAGLMLAGLRTWWLPAVGTSALRLYVSPLSPVMGWLASLLVVAAAIWWTLRRLDRVALPALLAGGVSVAAAEKAPGDLPRARKAAKQHRSRTVAWGFGGVALILVALAIATGEASSPGYAFGIGAALLISGLAAFAHLCAGIGRRGIGRRGVGRPANTLRSRGARPGASQLGARLGASRFVEMGARNTRRNRSRSVLSVALVASACFLLVVVAANRSAEVADVTDPASGAGGFTLVAQVDIPLSQDLNSAAVRSDLGFDAAESELLSGVGIVPFRLLPGEDVSCLNLFRPQRPKVLGVPHEVVERGAFTFQQLSEETDHPWTLLERDLEPGVVPAFADVNSALWILHAKLGDDLTIEDAAGRRVRLRLVGLLAKGIFQSEILVAERHFQELFPERAGYGWFLASPPLARVDEVAELLERRLGRFGFDATPTAERLAAYQEVESTYLATFQSLGGLALLLGTVGLGIVLLRNVLERRGELATLRALGFRRRSISWMVAAENAVLLVSGIAIGALAGLVAAAPRLLSDAQSVPWVSLAAILGMVLAIGSLAGWLAVRVSVRVPLLPALRAE